jgi:hypothetical protein
MHVCVYTYTVHMSCGMRFLLGSYSLVDRAMRHTDTTERLDLKGQPRMQANHGRGTHVNPNCRTTCCVRSLTSFRVPSSFFQNLCGAMLTINRDFCFCAWLATCQRQNKKQSCGWDLFLLTSLISLTKFCGSQMCTRWKRMPFSSWQKIIIQGLEHTGKTKPTEKRRACLPSTYQMIPVAGELLVHCVVQRVPQDDRILDLLSPANFQHACMLTVAWRETR